MVWAGTGADVRVVTSHPRDAPLANNLHPQRINPKLQPVAMVRDGAIVTGEGLVELGIFGTYLGDGTRCYRNVKAGHLMRSKVRLRVRVIGGRRTQPIR